MPQVMDGTPFKMSAAKRIHQFNFDPPYSERKNAAQHTHRHADDGGLREQNKCSDNGVAHSAANFADGFLAVG